LGRRVQASISCGWIRQAGDEQPDVAAALAEELVRGEERA